MAQQPSYRCLPILHRLAVRQDENFLTAYLAHTLLSFLEIEYECARTLMQFFCPDGITIPTQDLSTVAVETQFVTREGIPDLVLRWTDSILLIEAKVDSGFGTSQLKRYRAFLASRDENQKILVTLTRYAVDDAGNFSDLNIRWYELAETLGSLKPSTSVGQYLINEFLGLLKYRGITMDLVTWELDAGVRSFRNLVDMIGEALQLSNISILQKSGAWDWQGYYVEKKRLFIGIYFSEPAIIKIETEGAVVEPAELKFGRIEDGKWRFEVDLSAEQVHFFARSRARQLQFLEEWVAQAVEYGLALNVST